MSTGLERHTNEDGAYPKAGGHTLRFVKYVELKKPVFTGIFPAKSAARSAPSRPFETRLQLKQWELDLRLVVYLKSSKSWINDTSLLVNYNNLAKEAGTAHAVDCVVVAGRKPIDAERLASFEMYRTSLKDVRTYTFDEVLLKLRALRDYLAPPPSKPKPWGGKGDDLF